MIIAGKAGQGQIIDIIRPVMLSRNDMLKLKRQLIKFLPHATIFAATAGPAPNEALSVGARHSYEDASDSRALDLRREMKCPMRS